MSSTRLLRIEYVAAMLLRYIRILKKDKYNMRAREFHDYYAAELRKHIQQDKAEVHAFALEQDRQSRFELCNAAGTADAIDTELSYKEE